MQGGAVDLGSVSRSDAGHTLPLPYPGRGRTQTYCASSPATPTPSATSVLRQPLDPAPLDAGHELTLVVRKGVLPLVRRGACARMLVLPYEPYASDVEEHWDLFQDLFAAARERQPDVLLVLAVPLDAVRGEARRGTAARSAEGRDERPPLFRRPARRGGAGFSAAVRRSRRKSCRINLKSKTLRFAKL